MKKFLSGFFKTDDDVKEIMEKNEKVARAFRLSQEMRSLAKVLIEKAEELEKELAHGR